MTVGRGAPAPPGAPPARADTGDASLVAFVFTTALAMEAVTMPLLALHAGYSKPLIGVLAAMSAVTQLVSRLGSAPVMRFVPDRTLVWLAGLLLTASAVLIAFSARLPTFAVAELVQGLARGLFWTAIQSHLVRSRRRAVGRLATANFFSSFGQLLGPLAAGLLVETSFAASLLTAAGVALVAAALAASRLHRLPVFARSATPGVAPCWRNAQVRVGCWAGLSAGAWRALVSSYLPVILKDSGQTAAVVGGLISVTNGASIAGSGLSGMLGHRPRRTVLAGSILLTGAGIALAGPTAPAPLLFALVTAASGLGAGVLLTLSTAVAATAVDPDDRGSAVALAGGFRAGALLLAPLGVAAMLALGGLPIALGAAGGLIALPALATRRAAGRVPAEPA